MATKKSTTIVAVVSLARLAIILAEAAIDGGIFI
jgi:hypothetical protein